MSITKCVNSLRAATGRPAGTVVVFATVDNIIIATVLAAGDFRMTPVSLILMVIMFAQVLQVTFVLAQIKLSMPGAASGIFFRA